MPQGQEASRKSKTKNTLSMRTGKVTQEWLKTRRAWMKLHPPNHQGYYVCWKGDWVKAEEMELDHIQNRSTNPELRYDFDNLRPSCHEHNFGRKH